MDRRNRPAFRAGGLRDEVIHLFHVAARRKRAPNNPRSPPVNWTHKRVQQKLENFEAAIAMNFCYDIFVKSHDAQFA
jgi:hypothetical protein